MWQKPPPFLGRDSRRFTFAYRSIVNIFLVALLGTAGCALDGPPRISAKQRAALGSVGIICEPGDVAVRVHRPLTGAQATLAGAAAGFGTTAAAGIHGTRGGGGGLSTAIAGVIILAGATVGAGVGAVIGAAEGGISREHAIESCRVVTTALADVDPTPRITDELMSRLQTAVTLNTTRVHPSYKPARPPGACWKGAKIQPDLMADHYSVKYELDAPSPWIHDDRYADLIGRGIDTVLVIDHPMIGVTGNPGGKSRVKPAVAVRTRLIRLRDGLVISSYAWIETGHGKPYVHWSEDDGVGLRDKITQCAQKLGHRIADWLTGQRMASNT